MGLILVGLLISASGVAATVWAAKYGVQKGFESQQAILQKQHEENEAQRKAVEERETLKLAEFKKRLILGMLFEMESIHT